MHFIVLRIPYILAVDQTQAHAAKRRDSGCFHLVVSDHVFFCSLPPSDLPHTSCVKLRYLKWTARSGTRIPNVDIDYSLAEHLRA
jgi:hypothetical protein